MTLEARNCCGRKPVVEFESKKSVARLASYSVAVACPVCGRRVGFKHSALLIVEEPDYDRRVRDAATRQWNASFETSEPEAVR